MSKQKRPSWDEYFMNIAVQTARRGSCDRAQVGCVLTLDDRIIATGYNGSLWSDSTCDQSGHMIRDGHCMRTVHAEMNALIQTAIIPGSSTVGATAYVTHFPCVHCMKALIQARIRRIVYLNDYRVDADAIAFAQQANVELVKYDVQDEKGRR